MFGIQETTTTGGGKVKTDLALLPDLVDKLRVLNLEPPGRSQTIGEIIRINFSLMAEFPPPTLFGELSIGLFTIPYRRIFPTAGRPSGALELKTRYTRQTNSNRCREKRIGQRVIKSVRISTQPETARFRDKISTRFTDRKRMAVTSTTTDSKELVRKNQPLPGIKYYAILSVLYLR